MEQNSTSNRLHALDGIRGLAISLVVLNHVDASYVATYLPAWLSQIIFGSGVTGVSLLFILSGFLMAYIYPNPASGLHFLQKRYTRIFPLFLTLCTCMLLFFVMPKLAWYIRLATLMVLALGGHAVWVYGIKRYASFNGKKNIFLGFILLQLLVGAFYLLWVMRQPAIVFNQQTSALIRDGTIGLVNGTLTLPLGDYIPMLDGVYWSLAAEVLFYILYPFICVPILHFFIPKKRWLKVAVILALLPFFAGLNLLSHKIFVLSMLQPAICYYFVTGITLGYLYKHHAPFITNAHKLFPGVFYYGSIVLLVCILFSKLTILHTVSQSMTYWVHMLWAFPVTVIIAVALDQKTALAKMLSSKVPVFLGTISYSIYLSHTTILHLVQDAYNETNLFTNLFGILLIFLTTLLLSTLLYQLLEKPYFQRNKEKEKAQSYEQSKFERTVRKPAVVFTSIVLLSLIAIFNAYQSNFNFFSEQIPFKNIIFTNPTVSTQQIISFKQYPIVNLQVKAVQNNFEIITAHIMHQSVKTELYKNQNLIFTMKPNNEKNWYTTASYNLQYISDSPFHPFGIPLIAHSQGKVYDVQLSLSNPHSSEYIILDPKSLQGVYKVDKKALLTHPSQLLSFLGSRLMTVLSNQEAQQVFWLLLPFGLFLCLGFIPRKKIVLAR